MSFGLQLRIISFLFFISFMIPIACAGYFEVGDFFVEGEDIEDYFGQVRFYGEKLSVGVFSDEEILIEIDKIRGSLTEDGLVFGVSLGNNANISIQRASDSEVKIYDFYVDTNFEYSILGDDLNILEGAILVNGKRVDVEDGLIINGDEFFSEKEIIVDGNLVKGRFKVLPYGVLLSKYDYDLDDTYFVSDEEIVSVINGDFLIADDNFLPHAYSGAFLQRGDNDLVMEGDGVVEVLYEPLVGNNVFAIGSEREEFYLDCAGEFSIFAENRVEAGLIPVLNLDYGEDVHIINGRVSYNPSLIDVGEYSRGGSLHDMSLNGQPLPLTLDFPLKKIIVSPTQSHVIYDSNGNEVMTYNDFGFPITENLLDYDVLTIEGLREKYPDMVFETYESFSDTIPYVPSYATVHLLDEWIQSKDQLYVSGFVLSDENNAYAMGDSRSTPYEAQALIQMKDALLVRPITTLNSPLVSDRHLSFDSILIHEYAHIIEDYNPEVIGYLNYMAQQSREGIEEDSGYQSTQDRLFKIFDADEGMSVYLDGANIYSMSEEDFSNIEVFDLWLFCRSNKKFNPELGLHQRSIEYAVSKYLPATYALKDHGQSFDPLYASFFGEDVGGEDYAEVISTHMEEPFDVRKEKAGLYNFETHQRANYRALTRIEYNYGLISKEECEEILEIICDKDKIMDPFDEDFSVWSLLM
jgi:hypothetical protein